MPKVCSVSWMYPFTVWKFTIFRNYLLALLRKQKSWKCEVRTIHQPFVVLKMRYKKSSSDSKTITTYAQISAKKMRTDFRQANCLLGLWMSFIDALLY